MNVFIFFMPLLSAVRFQYCGKVRPPKLNRDIKSKIFLNFPNSLIWTNLPPGSDMSARLAATDSVNTYMKIQIFNL